jgi:hypothetical protein
MNRSKRNNRLGYILILFFFALCFKEGQCFTILKPDTLFIVLNSLDNNKQVTQQTGYIFCIHGEVTPTPQSDSAAIRKNISLFPFLTMDGDYTCVFFNDNNSTKYIQLYIGSHKRWDSRMQTKGNVVRYKVVKKRMRYLGFIPGRKHYYFKLGIGVNDAEGGALILLH